MIHLSEFNDFKKVNTLFLREHDKIVKSFNIEFIFLKSIKMPLICLYNIVDILFKNNSKNFKISDIILLTLTATAMLSNENKDNINILIEELTKRKISGYVNIVKNVLKSLKNLSNIVLKQDGMIIKNIEQFLNYKYSVQILSSVVSYVQSHHIRIKDFAYWFIVDRRTREANDLLDYVVLNYD